MWHHRLNLGKPDRGQPPHRRGRARVDSRGAHFCDGFPGAGPLASSAYSVLSHFDEHLELSEPPVTRAARGGTLLKEAWQARRHLSVRGLAFHGAA